MILNTTILIGQVFKTTCIHLKEA